MKRLLILAVILMALAPSAVAADSWLSEDGTILYYDGVPISWPSDPEAQASLMEALDAAGPPPPPPDWPFDAPEPVVKASVTYKNVDSGPALIEPIVYDWTGQGYWYWT